MNQMIKPFVMLAIIGLGLMWLMGGRLGASDVRGRRAPEITVEQWLNYEPDTKGKVILIDFWATWCGPCQETIPELNQLQSTFSRDLVVIGISSESESTLRDFMSRVPIAYTIARDSRRTMASAIHVTGIPHVIIIGTDGIVKWQGFPLNPQARLTEDVVRKVIEADDGVAARRKLEGHVTCD